MTELVLGTAQLGTSYGVVSRPGPPLDPGGAGHFLCEAERLGVAAFDTAPSYGAAEDIIGSSAATLPIHTKIAVGSSASKSLRSSLSRLGRSSVDVLYLHDPREVLRPRSGIIDDAFAHVGGAVGVVGASVYDTDELLAAVDDPRIGAVCVPLSFLDRHIRDQHLDLAARAGMRVYARSVFLQGVILADPAALPTQVTGLRPHVHALCDIARRLGRSRLNLALGWVRSRPSVRGIVVGTDGLDDLRATVSAFNAPPLSEDELDLCEHLEMPARELTDPRRWGQVS